MNYFLTGTEVWYTGNGLNKKATIVSVNNSVKGQVIIQLKAEIAWRSVTIKVTSTLSTTQAGGRRLLEQTTYDPVSGQTDPIECIKAEGAETCPDCDQQCDAQGFASDNCSSMLIFKHHSICFRAIAFNIGLIYFSYKFVIQKQIKYQSQFSVYQKQSKDYYLLIKYYCFAPSYSYNFFFNSKISKYSYLEKFSTIYILQTQLCCKLNFYSIFII
ncbi:unnamed protein product (macronuclear) [Paramecium tetraurelia]|uniref:Uncharacterized protein n=1 Tax=Paramecium tetraurelia TaxID=5888 RepID=A0CCD3_PARTE|nr:uncharacterized protein GSPATT00037235001 [Paramecium tetraurelia]CAK68450.1 unnamed protein product [Paramecium tetraurelia]|eukprot:XP_001435847.1 hypothetical protein (macronuclear) [Paramecium tetraurelia strain d4-2]